MIGPAAPGNMVGGWTSRLRNRVFVVGLAVIVALWIGAFYFLQLLRQAELTQARRDTANLALAFDEQLVRTLKGIDRGMLSLKRQLERDPRSFDLTAAVAEESLFEDVVLQVAIADAAGWLTAVSAAAPPTPVTVADRVHFLVHVERDTGEPFISVPVLSRTTGKWGLQMTRRLNHPDGSFAGVISVTIDPSYLARFYGTVDLGKQGTVTVVGSDGIVRARAGPGNEASLVGPGQSVLDAPMFTQPAPAGNFAAKCRFDGTDRVYSYRRLRGFPLIVVVGFGMDDIMADLPSDVTVASAMLIVSLALAALLLWLGRELERKRRDQSELVAERRRLREVVDAVDGPLALFDTEGRIQFWNEGFIRFYPKIAPLLRVGLKRAQIRQALIELGYLASDPVLVANTQSPAEFPYRTLDGRQLFVRRTVMADGALLISTTDITALRKAELRLEAAIRAIDGGFALFDAEDRLVLCNDAFRAEMSPIADCIETGMTIADIYRMSWDAGMASTALPGEMKEAWVERWLNVHRAADGTPIELHRGRIRRAAWFRTAADEVVRVTADVTDLRRAELRLQSAIRAMDGGFALFDDEDRLILCNDAYREELQPIADRIRPGLTFHELYGMGWDAGLALPSALLGETREEWIERRYRHHRLADGVRTELHRDGRSWSSARFRSAEGEIVRVTMEITDLRQAERRLAAAIAAVNDGFALFDAEDRLVLCNDGYRREVEHAADKIVPGMTFQEVCALAWDAGLVGETRPEETRESYLEHRLALHHAADGRPLEIRRNERKLRIAEYRTAEGEVVRVSADVTDLDEKEAELRRLLVQNELLSEATLARRTFMLQAVMDGMPDGLVILDESRHAVFWNHGFLRLCGLADAVDGNDAAFLKQAGLEQLFGAFRLPPDVVQELTTGEDSVAERMLADGRSLRFQLLDAGGRNELLWVSDMSGRLRQEAERLALSERLLLAQKNDAVGTIVSTVAHDFNNLLTVVLGFASLSQAQIDVLRVLPDKLPTDDPAARRAIGHVMDALGSVGKSLANIAASATRGRRIVSNLTEFVRAEPSEQKPSDLVETVRVAGRLMRISLPASARLEVEAESGSVLARHDPIKIEQVLLNLCLNAAHALEGRPGHIRIKLEPLRTDGGRTEALRAAGMDGAARHHVIKRDSEGWVHHWRGLMTADRYVRIDVADSGSGMSEATMSRMFETFFTTKPKGVGTGLGLASVASIVDAHGGAIHVRSRSGEGTVFSLYLPAMQTIEAEPREAVPSISEPEKESAPGSAPRGLRVLVVDDEEHLAELMELSLERAGYAVERFTDATGAAARLERDPDTVDLVVTDQTMPGLTGAMLAERAVALRPGLPVLLCTGYSARLIDEEQLPKGVAAMMRKPFTPKDLTDRVASLLAA
ncbi:MAG: PAS-domain containing protein [Proteobacteria bacterium]|nr:PAS-domain containing protein [Pseudomonadota bacterium]